MLDVLEEEQRLRWIGTANELDAAYAADGYARIKGLGALITTYGVGELSAVNGMAGAYAESVPVVHIVGTPATDVQRARALVHHSLCDGDFDGFVRIAAEVTAAQAHLTVENAVDEIDRVLEVAVQSRKPVYIAIPSDVAVAEARVRPRPLTIGAGRRVDIEQLSAFRERVQTLLANAANVSLLVGHLVDRFGARQELASILQTGRVRAAVLSMSKGLVDETNPNFVGLYAGAISDQFTRETVEQADVIITAGVLLADGPTGGFTHDLALDRRVDLGIESANVCGTVYEGVPLAEGLKVIAQALQVCDIPSANVSRQSSNGKSSSVAVLDPGATVTPDLFWERLSRYLRQSDMIFADQGTAFYGAMSISLPAGAEVIGQAVWASIGYTLPAILGAQLADPSRRAVLVIGDGAAQMTIQELGSFVRLGLKPLIVVLNNDGYTIERAIRSPKAQYHDIARWDWPKIPSAFGAADEVRVLSVRSVAALDSALQIAQTEERMVMLEVQMEALARPEFMDRFLQSVTKRQRAAPVGA